MELSVNAFWEAAQKPLSLKLVAGEELLDQIIHETALNRPGLAFAGVFSVLLLIGAFR